jgi:hypothetical protein
MNGMTYPLPHAQFYDNKITNKISIGLGDFNPISCDGAVICCVQLPLF